MLASPAMRRRLRAVILLSFPLVLALPVASARASSTGSSLDVEMLDNVFAPRIVRIPVGGTVEWTNEGRSPHNVTADDGAFASTDLAPGEVFDETFATEGAYPYFCSIHGSPGAGMTGLVLVGDAPIPGAPSDVGPGRENHRREMLVLFLRAEDVEALNEGQTGVDHHRKLARKNRQFLCLDLLATADFGDTDLTAFFFDRGQRDLFFRRI